MNRLEGKVAIVTGASKGLGAAIAKKLAAEGASVVVNYASSKTDADRVVSEIAAKGGNAIAVQANVGDRAEIAKLFAESKKAFGKLDVLVNNAGVYEFLPLEAITDAHYRRLFDVNVLGLIATTQEAVKQFGENGGSIINVSSIVSLTPPVSASVYSATKGAVDALTVSWARELAVRKIRVNTIHPGLIPTEGVQANMQNGNYAEERMKKLISVTPLGRLGTPEDVAHAAVYLASDESAFMTGEGIVLSGGYR
ncbi:SDR family oxidoreductase [Alloacidobacterium dinghuense]|uniref:SDR family oxidoreductase n=1 Tax=Alloacidobacterium dinghuense TaxID=2763107 RepID=A0A7G8BQ06_9BACT|nr:SDR family oxidoreductase [Alloacidobacterium dinghuense]QNI34626.1 SDR family oxidoreductase [Alloacidobacterium dinghuense]